MDVRTLQIEGFVPKDSKDGKEVVIVRGLFKHAVSLDSLQHLLENSDEYQLQLDNWNAGQEQRKKEQAMKFLAKLDDERQKIAKQFGITL